MDLFVNGWCTTQAGTEHGTGDTITVGDAEGSMLIRDGLCRPYVPVAEGGAAEVTPAPGLPGVPDVARPAASDVKPAWVEYAVALGWDRAAAEAATKQQLADQLPGR